MSLPDPNELDETVEAVVGRRAPFTQLGDWTLLSGASREARELYWALSAHISVSRDDTEVWPSLKTLARIVGVKKPDNLTPYMLELEVLGAVEVIRSGGGIRSRNRYVVHQTPPPGYRGVYSLGDWYGLNKRPAHSESTEERKAREAAFDAWLESVRKALKEHCAKVAAQRAAARKAKKPLPETELFVTPSPDASRTPAPGGTGRPAVKGKSAGRSVPPRQGVRTPAGGGSVPPRQGVEQDEEEQHEPPLSPPAQPSQPAKVPAQRDEERENEESQETGNDASADQAAVAATMILDAFVKSAKASGRPVTSKLRREFYSEAMELLEERCDQPYVEHLMRLAAELPPMGWWQLSTHAMKNPMPEAGGQGSGMSRAEQIAACPECDEYGQVEMPNGSVANCRHPQLRASSAA